MSLLDHGFLTLQGKPVTGRMPAHVVVEGDFELNGEQRAGVAHAYKLFRDAARAAVTSYLVAHRTLTDGTTVRMVSNCGQDTVYVKPGGAPAVKAITLAGYVILPRDAAHTSGWNKGSTPDSARAYIAAAHDRAIATLPPKIELHVKLQAGAVDWRGAKDVTLTWDHGGNNRYDTSRWDSVFVSGIGIGADTSSSGVYYKGTKIDTPIGVVGCAIFQGHLIVVGDTTVYACASPISRIDADLARGHFTKEVSPTWSAIAITGSVASARRASAWHFKPDGSRASGVYVYTSLGVNTWNLHRMRTEAVPMCKRHLDFAIVAGNLTCTVSDVAYTAEVVGTKLDGVYMDAANTATGALTYTGKRLWGVDYDAAGAELLVEFKRAGTGAQTASGASYTVAWDLRWGVYVNDAQIVRADYVLPTLSLDSAAPAASTAGGNIKSEFLAVHQLDGRDRAAVVERVTLGYTGAVSASAFDTDNALPASRKFDTLAAQVEVIVGGSLVATHSAPIDAALVPDTFGDLWHPDSRFASLPLTWNQPQDGSDFSRLYVASFPQVGGFNQENIYEQLYQGAGGSVDGREAPNFFDCYPNQVSDTLGKLFFNYTSQLRLLEFNLRYGNASHYPDQTAIIGTPYTLGDHAHVSPFLFALGPWSSATWFIRKGMAIPHVAPLHLVVAGSDLFTNQFFDTVKRMVQRNRGLSETGKLPTQFAGLLTRPDLVTGFTETDLLAPALAKVTADGNSPDATTFHIDPVRLV